MTIPRHIREDSEDDVDGITQLDPRSWASGTQTEPLIIDDEDDEGFDVFGTIQAAESSRAASGGPVMMVKTKGKRKTLAGAGPSKRPPLLSCVRNDIPLFDPVPSDTDTDIPSPAPLQIRRTVRRIDYIEIPHVPQSELDTYRHWSMVGEPSAKEAEPRPSQIPLPPTPPTTGAGHFAARPMSSATASEADLGLPDEPEDGRSSSGPPQRVDEDEEMEIDHQLPSPSASPKRPARRRFRDMASSADPLADDWESRTGQSEREDGDDGVDEDEEDESEDEKSYEEEEKQPTPQVKKSLRGYDERREASKAVLQQRLRMVAPTTRTRVLSHSSPAVSAISISSTSEAAMAPSKRPPKRKMATRQSAAEPDTDSYGIEGEDEVQEVLSSDFDDSWDRKPKKAKGGKKKDGKKKRNSRAVSEESSAAEDDILDRHREFCEKCKQGPADALLAAALRKKKNRGGKKKRNQDDDEVSEDEVAEELQGWLECEGCVSSWHWGCLGSYQQQDALQYLERKEGPPAPDKKKRRDVNINEFLTFECRKCLKAPECMVCRRAQHVDPDAEEEAAGVNTGANQTGEVSGDVGGDQVMEEAARGEKPPVEEVGADKAANGDTVIEADGEPPARHIQFRCLRCTQSAHYECLPDPFGLNEGSHIVDIARWHQEPTVPGDAWTCHQCRDWIWKVDMVSSHRPLGVQLTTKVIAWRPLPADAKEEDTKYKPAWNADLPREYLVKFVDRGFRHATWVNHSWLKIMGSGKLRNFLDKGPTLDLVTDETLAAKGDVMSSPTIANIMSQSENEILGESRRRHHHPAGVDGGGKDEWTGAGPPPDVDGKTSLPIAWSTIDRVLDIYLTPPPIRKKNRSKRRISSESATGLDYDGPDGLMPTSENLVSIDDWERLAGRQLGEDNAEEIAGLVSWLFAKWDDLQYEQSTWDTPPPRESELYPAYKRALKRYLGSRNVMIPILSAAECKKRDAVRFADIEPPSTQPDCVVGGTLMKFQMEGLQWLLTKYYKRESAILADDMGLGKTVQIAALLGYLGTETIYPCLVVVPNSTITNWVREFEKWVPHMRVVPFYGEAASKKIIKEYELYHKGQEGQAEGLKAHIVLTTYDMITGKDFRVFKGIPRWETLIIDEGQRLKSDSTLMWIALQKLNTVHRVLLTGTPLNNNIRELFNLLNFLDPNSFIDRSALEKRFEQDSLTEELVRELHALAQPFILRRIKDDVLRLPPKVEIIVPISLTRTQVEVYKHVLENNLEKIESAMAERKRKEALKAKKKPAQIEGGGLLEEPAKADGAGEEAGGAVEPAKEANGDGDADADMGEAVAPAAVELVAAQVESAGRTI